MPPKGTGLFSITALKNSNLTSVYAFLSKHCKKCLTDTKKTSKEYQISKEGKKEFSQPSMQGDMKEIKEYKIKVRRVICFSKNEIFLKTQ